MENRSAKRFIIILIYLALLALISFTIYKALLPEETCSDKVKNQNEEDVDCGGVCAPCRKISAEDLKVENRGYVENERPGKFDFWALVSNPNNLFGAKSFQYEIKFKNSSGEIVSQRDGFGFILPGERKYIVENNLDCANAPNSIDFAISKTEWVEFNGYYEKPDLNIVNKNYSQVSSGTGFSEASGLLKNKSPFDFNVIKVQIVLKDADEKVIALNSTEMRTVKSGEERDFKALWPNRFSGDVAYVDAQAEVNVFESENFLKNYTGTGNPSL